MEDSERKKRLEKAVSYLIARGEIDSNAPATDIAKKMRRNFTNVSAALGGESKYLTQRFVKMFCAVYGNVINYEWVWSGCDKMVANEEETHPSDNVRKVLTEEKLNMLTKDELVILVKDLMILHQEQTEMYRMLIRQNEVMIRNGQERFNSITNIIYKNA